MQDRQETQAGGASGPDRLAIVVHAYYPEVFREILSGLEGLEVPHRLFVTTTHDRAAEMRGILDEFGLVHELLACENRGRDVAPFLAALAEVRRLGLGFVLKLHTKRSPHRKDGDLWRQEMYACLADAGQVRWILDAMRRDKGIGLVGPVDHVVPMTTNWTLNRARVRTLAARLGIPRVDVKRDKFVAGTMFMARVEALAPLTELGTISADFEPEEGQVDGTLAHALERAFAYSVRAAGFQIAGAAVARTPLDQRLVLVDASFRCSGRIHAQPSRWWRLVRPVVGGARAAGRVLRGRTRSATSS